MTITSITTSNIGTLSAVDLNKLPAPDFTFVKTYESTLSEMINLVDKFIFDKTGEHYIFNEADPAYSVVEACAYQRWIDLNDYASQTLQNMVAFAKGFSLDHIGAHPRVNCTRLVITQADNTVTPPITEVLERDDDYRLRMMLKPESYTTSGSLGAYVFYALSASGNVADVGVYSPDHTGNVIVTLLSHDANGVASLELCGQVRAYLMDEKIHTVCDYITCQPAAITEYTVKAHITARRGFDAVNLVADATTGIRAYADAHFKLEHNITESGLNDAAFVYGVQKVEIVDWTNDIVCNSTQAARCIGIEVTLMGSDI